MIAMAALADRATVAADVARRLGLATTTLYSYVNGDGTPKAAGQALLDGQERARPGARAAMKEPRRPPPDRQPEIGGA